MMLMTIDERRNLREARRNLLEAIRQGNDSHLVNIVQANPDLVKAGSSSTSAASPNSLPLVHAIKEGPRAKVVPTLKLLLDHGADVNLRDKYGYTPIFHAVLQKNAPAVQCLLNYGAKVNVRNVAGNTPLLLAIMLNEVELARLLLDQGGASVNVCNLQGNTPLKIAMKWSDTQSIRLLLEHGADLRSIRENTTTRATGSSTQPQPTVLSSSHRAMYQKTSRPSSMNDIGKTSSHRLFI